MAFTDFIVQWDEDPAVITERILNSIIVHRLKFKKPAVCFFSGDSGEGKSYSAIVWQLIILKIQGVDIRKYLDDINVYTPIEYPRKLQKLLYDKELKKVNCICVHEAREVVKAKNWHSFLNQAISDVNAMSRSVKRLCFMIVSQFIRDISTDIRYTINYYIKVRRPMGGNRRARLNIYVMWKDDRDLESPKLRKRRLSGYLVMPNGKRKRYTPRYLELKMLEKDIAKRFDEADTKAKSTIIKKKMNKLMKELRADMEVKDDKIQLMAEWYTSHQNNLNMLGRWKHKKFIVNKDVKKMHDLTDFEVKQLQKKLNEKMKEKEMIAVAEAEKEAREVVNNG